jgi:hypothetical protein
MDLKSKAEAVLSSTFSDSFTGQKFSFFNARNEVLCPTHLMQFYRPSVASSLFYRVVLRLQRAVDVPALLGTLLSQMLPPAFVRLI